MNYGYFVCVYPFIYLNVFCFLEKHKKLACLHIHVRYWIIVAFFNMCLCTYHIHKMFIPFICRLMASQCSFQRPIKSSRLKDVLSRSAFAFLVLVLNGETGEREGEMERSWVMDALCVSVIANYWTLPFKASLRWISHFCLPDWWREGGPDWGHSQCVLNMASLGRKAERERERRPLYCLQMQSVLLLHHASAQMDGFRPKCIYYEAHLNSSVSADDGLRPKTSAVFTFSPLSLSFSTMQIRQYTCKYKSILLSVC